MQGKKLILILGLIGIAFGMYYIATNTLDVATYPTFAEARQSGKTQTVIGELSPNHEVLTTEEHIEFYLTDNNSETVQVMYLGSMPNDLMNSEKVTVTGSFINDSLFKASKILTKCPSKYEGADEL
tara:strand:- start:3 stop:380 length:378 start_codon:yes stop_codon:yes gene_type:complete